MDQKQFDAVLSDAETRLRRLKVLYEQWFMGIERVEPAQARKEFEDLLAHMRKEPPSNTAQRFRLQQLVQRHVALSTHWRRVGRQIEEGTYQRDLLRAKKRKQHVGQLRDTDEPDLDVSYDVDVDEDLAAALAEADRLAYEPPPSAGVALGLGRAGPAAAPKLPLGAAGSMRPALQPEDVSATRSSITPFAMPGADGSRAKPSTQPKIPLPPPIFNQPLAAAGGARPAARAPGAVPASRSAGPSGMAARVAAAMAAEARSASPTAAVKPTAAVAQSGRSKNPADFSTSDIDRVYNQYIAARGRNAERTDNVKRETIEKTIRGMLPQLAQKHAGKKIDFEVVVKDGRVALKPVAK